MPEYEIVLRFTASGDEGARNVATQLSSTLRLMESLLPTGRKPSSVKLSRVMQEDPEAPGDI